MNRQNYNFNLYSFFRAKLVQRQVAKFFNCILSITFAADGATVPVEQRESKHSLSLSSSLEGVPSRLTSVFEQPFTGVLVEKDVPLRDVVCPAVFVCNCWWGLHLLFLASWWPDMSLSCLAFLQMLTFNSRNISYWFGIFRLRSAVQNCHVQGFSIFQDLLRTSNRASSTRWRTRVSLMTRSEAFSTSKASSVSNRINNDNSSSSRVSSQQQQCLSKSSHRKGQSKAYFGFV